MGSCAYHGVNQALVPVPQVGGQPSRRLVDGLVGPLTVREVQRREPLVFRGGILEPREANCCQSCASWYWKVVSGCRTHIGIVEGNAGQGGRKRMGLRALGQRMTKRGVKRSGNRAARRMEVAGRRGLSLGNVPQKYKVGVYMARYQYFVFGSYGEEILRR